jgi:hypothetical protein
MMRIVVDYDGKQIKPGDPVSFPCDLIQHTYTEQVPFMFAGMHPDENHMVLITNLANGKCHRVAPSVIGGRFVEAPGSAQGADG